MKKNIFILIAFGLALSLNGCGEDTEKEKKRDSFIKHVEINGSNAPTKLPL